MTKSFSVSKDFPQVLNISRIVHLMRKSSLSLILTSIFFHLLILVGFFLSQLTKAAISTISNADWKHQVLVLCCCF